MRGFLSIQLIGTINAVNIKSNFFIEKWQFIAADRQGLAITKVKCI
jgi:hypothetical protein